MLGLNKSQDIGSKRDRANNNPKIKANLSMLSNHGEQVVYNNKMNAEPEFQDFDVNL